ncbi:MAG: hypothetical protein ACWGSQ_03990, partial [Longimicrobiales bacterium]
MGLSILGDLREEYEEIVSAGSHSSPRLWYWRSALELSLRYSLVRARDTIAAQRARATIRSPFTTDLGTDLRFGLRML